jgi:hypothetical protein
MSAGPRGPGLEETIVIALAAGRLARAISVDQIAELLRCPVCVGWWTSLATSFAWPGRMRVRRGIAAAGVQVLMTLAERLISEQGRAAISRADLADERSQAAA